MPMTLGVRRSLMPVDGTGSMSATSICGEPHFASVDAMDLRAESILRAIIRRAAHSVSFARRADSIASACMSVQSRPYDR